VNFQGETDATLNSMIQWLAASAHSRELKVYSYKSNTEFDENVYKNIFPENHTLGEKI